MGTPGKDLGLTSSVVRAVLTALCLGLGSVLGACTGVVANPTLEDAPTNPGAPEASPVGGSDGVGGRQPDVPDPDSGAVPQPNPPQFDCSGVSLPADTARRLNILELDTVAHDVLGLSDAPFAAALGTDYGERVGAFLGTTERFVQDYFDATEAIAARAVAAQWLGDSCSNVDCVVSQLEPLLTELHRGHVRPAHLSALRALAREAFDAGHTGSQAASLTLWATLNSPDFLLVGTSEGRLEGRALAERLALALWSSVPDDELLRAAEAGELETEEGLEVQVRRMLDHPEKGHRFLESWVDAQFDLISANALPIGLSDVRQGRQLAEDMRTEADLILQHTFDENLPIARLVASNTTFVNDRLAEFYGLQSPQGSGFSEVSTEGSGRVGGLLTTGAVLAQEVDLIHRGVNVLHTFMCLNLAAPNPEVLEAAEGALPEDATVRQNVEYRMSEASCAGCHNLIDPLGAAYEAFDEAGSARTRYPNGDTVSYQHQIDGQTVSGAGDISALLADGSMQQCLASQLLGWVSFRRLSLRERDHACATQELIARTGDETRMKDLVVQAMLSETFRSRSAE